MPDVLPFAAVTAPPPQGGMALFRAAVALLKNQPVAFAPFLLVNLVCDAHLTWALSRWPTLGFSQLTSLVSQDKLVEYLSGFLLLPLTWETLVSYVVGVTLSLFLQPAVLYSLSQKGTLAQALAWAKQSWKVYTGVDLLVTVLVLLGLVAGIIPGLWLMTRYFIAAPVAAAEGVGVREAMRRSKARTGARLAWTVFVGLVCSNLIIGLGGRLGVRLVELLLPKSAVLTGSLEVLVATAGVAVPFAMQVVLYCASIERHNLR